MPSRQLTSDCPSCGGVTRIIPGPSYRPDDIFVFVEVSAGFRRARLGSWEVRRLRHLIQEAPAAVPALALRRAIEWLPGLAPLAQRLSGNQRQLQLAVSTILTIAHAPYSIATTDAFPRAAELWWIVGRQDFGRRVVTLVEA